MRRIFAVWIFALIILSFSGCSKNAEPVNMNKLYSVTADVKMGDVSATVGLNRLGNGAWDVTFTKPDNLNGMSVSYENDKANISYNGLTFTINKEDIPASAIVSNLTKVMDNAALGSDMSYTKEDGKITAKGKVDNNAYELILDENSGIPVELKLNKIKMDVNFSEYKPIT